MGNASQENIRVRQAITDSLFALMEKKPFEKITVSELVSTAQVARASFYRNFESREEVIDRFIEEIHLNIINTHRYNPTGRPITREEFVQEIEQSLAYVLTLRKPLMILFNGGFVSYLQNIADIYMEEIAGDMLYNSANRYLLYFLSGASLNMLFHWLQDDTPESPHALAQACADYFLPILQMHHPVV